MLRKICILANKYPNNVEPTTNMFIQQLAWQFADMGYECFVICPMPTNFDKRYKKLKEVSEEKTENGNMIKVYRPKYKSLGQSGSFLQKTRVRLTTKFYEDATLKTIKKYSLNPDIVYSYFICPTSVVAAHITKKLGIPSFMEHGEALYSGDKKYGNKYLKKQFKYLTGCIAVSNQNRDYLLNNDVLDKGKILVQPNCFREERFYKIDKKAARKHFGWDEDKFIVGYCGSLDERKGVLRVEKAVDKIEGVYMAFAGGGKLVPMSKKVIYCKPVLHSDLIYFYNALDVFVLPTTAEGSCTATAEAIGCGCPIISSNRSFNDNLCDESNSILVGPMDINQISTSIESLYKDQIKLSELSNGSLKKRETLKQKERMNKVVDFIKSKI